MRLAPLAALTTLLAVPALAQAPPALLEMDRLFGLRLGTGNPNSSSLAGKASTATSQLART